MQSRTTVITRNFREINEKKLNLFFHIVVNEFPAWNKINARGDGDEMYAFAIQNIIVLSTQPISHVKGIANKFVTSFERVNFTLFNEP